MTYKELLIFLKENKINFKKNICAKNLTTFRVSSNIPLLIYPKDSNEVKNILNILNTHCLKYRVLGNGSNLLIKHIDEETIIISLKELSAWKLIDGHYIYAQAGVSLMSLSRKTAQMGLSGLEFASGIPATIGGAIKMNAGAHGSDISNIFEYAEILKDGKIEKVKDLNFSYRKSNIEDSQIILGACLKLKKGSIEDIQKHRIECLDYRKKTQPLQTPSAGSSFINPTPIKSSKPVYAAKLIEECGLKGFRIGGAKVSDMHANWIVNPEESATASDIQELINYIKKTVQEKTSYNIKPEIVIWE